MEENLKVTGAAVGSCLKRRLQKFCPNVDRMGLPIVVSYKLLDRPQSSQSAKQFYSERFLSILMLCVLPDDRRVSGGIDSSPCVLTTCRL